MENTSDLNDINMEPFWRECHSGFLNEISIDFCPISSLLLFLSSPLVRVQLILKFK